MRLHRRRKRKARQSKATLSTSRQKRRSPSYIMAPTTNAAKGIQQNRSRPVSKMVTPAIPLPYVQKRQQMQRAKDEAAAAAAKAKAREEEEALQTPDSPQVAEISTPPHTAATPSIVNGSSDRQSVKADEISAPTSPEPIAESTPEHPVQQVELPSKSEHLPVSISRSLKLISPFADLQEEAQSAHSEARSASSRSTYQMPPPFVPANRTNHSPHLSSNYNNIPNSSNNESPRFPPPSFNGLQHMHHGHPSTSSLVFGGYPESNNSSPVPLSAGHFPPPPFPPHGHHPHHGPHQSDGGFQHNGTNGFSPLAPPPGYFRQDGFNNAPTDFSRRQMNSFGLPDGYSPLHSPMGDPRVNSFDPHTPHSFQGSQSSAPVEVKNTSVSFGNHSGTVTNGTNGHDEGLSPQQPRQQSQVTSQAQPSTNYAVNTNGHSMMPIDHLDGLVQYLQSQFGEPGIADFTVELRYSDDRSQPVRIPGHGLIFARSPTLKELISKQHQGDEYGRTLLLESDNRFLRSDGFWMAVQRLYGGPLLEASVLASHDHQSSAHSEHGTPESQFDFALGYASAGIILQIPPVTSRGLDFASRLVGWSTAEKAIDFYLEGGLETQWGTQNGHGPNSNILIHNTTSFLINNFPVGFKLDTTVPDATHKSRLPHIDERPTPGHNPRLSFIKFGDHPSQEISKSSSNAITIALSKILLKLPFQLLKYVLESSRLGNASGSGWASTTLRQEVMHAVVAERERRRLKVLSSNISNKERKTRSAEWEVVGWQESVFNGGSGNNEGGTLLAVQRTWVGFLASESQQQQ